MSVWFIVWMVCAGLFIVALTADPLVGERWRRAVRWCRRGVVVILGITGIVAAPVWFTVVVLAVVGSFWHWQSEDFRSGVMFSVFAVIVALLLQLIVSFVSFPFWEDVDCTQYDSATCEAMPYCGRDMVCGRANTTDERICGMYECERTMGTGFTHRSSSLCGQSTTGAVAPDGTRVTFPTTCVPKGWEAGPVRGVTF